MTLNKADFNLVGYSSCHVSPGHQSEHQSERHERLRRQRQLLAQVRLCASVGPAPAPAAVWSLRSVISHPKDVVPARKTRFT